MFHDGGGNMKSYKEKIQEQIEQYREIEDIHALPRIFHLWSHHFILPGLQDVFEVTEIIDFYAEAMARARCCRSGTAQAC